MTLAEPAAESTAKGSPPPATRPKRNKIKTGEGRLAFYLVTPTIALLGLIVGYPIVKAIYNSFLSDNQKLNPATGQFEQAGAWTGLTNFKHWLLQQCPSGTGKTISCPTGNIGSQFWSSVSVTVGFTVVTVILETVIGMVFALMMNRAFRGRRPGARRHPDPVGDPDRGHRQAVAGDLRPAGRAEQAARHQLRLDQ